MYHFNCHRPAAYAHGGTDELAHHLGHTRVHLGLNMAATAVPIVPEEARDNAQAGSEDVVLYFGIIDILQVRQCRAVIHIDTGSDPYGSWIITCADSEKDSVTC